MLARDSLRFVRDSVDALFPILELGLAWMGYELDINGCGGVLVLAVEFLLVRVVSSLDKDLVALLDD